MPSPTRHAVSRARYEANRINARKSTGPRTPQGKARSCLNAVRHGLTSLVLRIAEEDCALYEQFCADICAAYHPHGGLELRLARSIADDEWRLRHLRALETFPLPAFPHDCETLALCSLYEQRITRRLRRNEAHLQSLQCERLAAFEQALEAARRLTEIFCPTAFITCNGFVFSTSEIRRISDRKRRLARAKSLHMADSGAPPGLRSAA